MILLVINDFNYLCNVSKDEKTLKNDKTKSRFENHNRTTNKTKIEASYDKQKKKIENNSAFDEIFKYKQSYIDDGKFLNKNEFIKNKNDCNLFSKDNIFSMNKINQYQIEINKKTQENRVNIILK